MSILKSLRARLRALVFRDAADRELRDEIRFHLDEETAKNIRTGMSPDEARRVALAHFGGVENVREAHRDVRRLQWIEDFGADVRFAFRALRRTYALSAAAVITLALGIGANVAIFSAVNAVVLQPLPFHTPDRLVVVTEENPEKHWHLQVAAPANLLDWRTSVPAFQDVTGYFENSGHSTLTGRGDPQVMNVATVMGNFFSTFGARPAMGRTLTFEETFKRGTGSVIVLSNRGWREHFAADPDILGKSITLDGDLFQVVGVMAPEFAYPSESVDAWRPTAFDDGFAKDIGFRRAHFLRAVARLKPGVTIAQADAQLQSVVSRLKRDYPETNRVMGAEMLPLHDFLIGDTRLPLLILLTSVAFLLLIACANVGNLLLVQAAGRERETAVRLALGAGRARLVRQALAESLVLSTLGGALGLLVGWGGTRAFVHLQPTGMLRVSDFGIDTRVLMYVLAITVGSALVFGVAPALWSRSRNPADVLKAGGRASAKGVGSSGRVHRWGDVLVVGEVALALLMMVGAGLLVRSFYQIRNVDAGFDPRGVLATAFELNARYDSAAKVHAFMSEFESRLRALPGVTAATLESNTPFNGTGYTSDYFAYGRLEGAYGTEVGHRTVTPSYFATMKIPVLRGRTFGAEDRTGAPLVIIINDALAQSYFKGENPVGQRITFDKVPVATSNWYTIIGVVGSEHVNGLSVPAPAEAFHAEAQAVSTYMAALVRTSGDPLALAAPVRAVLHDLDPTLAPILVKAVDVMRDDSMARVRFLTTLLLAFAVIGVTLSVVGVYGVLAQLSRNRTREMGIRIALGASASRVRWLVVRQGLQLTLIGLAVGGTVALLATRVMSSLLFGTTPRDPATLITVAFLLAATSLVAAWLPAREGESR